MPPALGDRESQQFSMPSGGLYPSAAPPALMAPKKYGFRDALKDVLIPTAGGALAGGVGAVAGLVYGLDTAAGKYRLSRDPLAQMQYAQAYAQAQYAAENPDLDYNIAMARRGASVPADQQLVQFLEEKGLRYGTPEFDKAWQRLKAPGFNPYAAPVTYGQDAIMPSRNPDMVPDRVIPGAGQMAPANVDARVDEASRTAGAEGYGRAAGDVAARTAPDAIAAQAELEASKAEAVDTTKGNEALYSTLYTANNDMQSSLRILEQIRAKVAEGPETGVLAEWQALIDPDLQSLNAQLRRNTLSSLTAAKQAGATFGSMSEGEWEVLGSLGGRLKNQKEANLDILDDQISQIYGQLSENNRKLRSVPRRGRPEAPAAPTKKKSAGDYLNAQ